MIVSDDETMMLDMLREGVREGVRECDDGVFAADERNWGRWKGLELARVSFHE